LGADDVAMCYRIIESRQPRQRDFWSPERRGTALRNPDLRYMYDGVSMFGTLAAAAIKAATFPYLGQWIAEIDLTRSGNLRVEQTGRRRERHYTVWGDPDELLRCVVRVFSVVVASERS